MVCYADKRQQEIHKTFFKNLIKSETLNSTFGGAPPPPRASVCMGSFRENTSTNELSGVARAQSIMLLGEACSFITNHTLRESQGKPEHTTPQCQHTCTSAMRALSTDYTKSAECRLRAHTMRCFTPTKNTQCRRGLLCTNHVHTHNKHLLHASLAHHLANHNPLSFCRATLGLPCYKALTRCLR